MLKLTVQELVASGCLSRCTFSEEGGDCVDNDASMAGNVNNLPHINAAKISLMMVKASAKYLCGDSDIDSGNNDDVIDGVDYCSLNLGNFTVKLSSPHTDKGPLDDDLLARAKASKEAIDFQPLDYRIESPLDRNNPFNIPRAFLRFLSLDALAQLFEEQGHIDTMTNVGADQIDGKDDFISDWKKFDDMSRVSWVLRGMEVQTGNVPQRSQVKPISCTRKMQHMGRMMYEIFSPTDSHSLHALINNRFTLEEHVSAANIHNNDLDSEPSRSKSPKLQRPTEKSLFSDLLASGHFPTSVCRLLSDMIDVGEDGMADCPYTSHTEVIDDLMQMISLPRLFLDDPENSFFANSLRFGLGCYGRTDQVKSILSLASRIEGKSVSESPECLETIIVKGIAGSGKTFLVHSISEYLTTQDWIIFGGKFEQSVQHENKDVVSIAFDKLIATLVSMRDGSNEHDVEYSRLAVEAISEVLDQDSLASLANRIPSMKALIPNDSIRNGNDGDTAGSNKGSSYWRLVFLLSSLLSAILSAGRHILMYFDDLQWSSKKLAIISELVVSMANLPHARSKLLFIGMYRGNEIQSAHPVNTHMEVLKQHKIINITNIDLPNLSRNDVAEMTMNEMRLPRRMVVDLSDAIYKKAGQGHPLFTTQLLNSLVRDATITHSPAKRRYSWDCDRLNKIQTLDSVASFIVSNLSTLSDDSIQSLRVLACLGMQTEKSILNHLKSCPGLKCSEIFSILPRLIDAGIVEENTLSITFCHDIIRYEMYQDLAVEQRKAMHLLIAECIGSQVPEFDLANTVQDYAEEKKLEETDVPSQSLICIATDHINFAPDLVLDETQRTRFAAWNLAAAAETTRNSNFQASIAYYKAGISFLGSNVWSHETHELSYNLHKGAAFALLAMGDAEHVKVYANAIIQNDIERSLHAHYLIIKSLECSGKNQEAVDMALVVLRQLDFELPSVTRLQLGYLVGGLRGRFPEFILSRVRETNRLASQHRVDELFSHQQRSVEQPRKDVLNILSAIIHAGARVRSPYLPLIVCETVNYALKHLCVCAEASLSFAYFGYILLWMQGDCIDCCRWGRMALSLVEKEKRPFTETRMILSSMVLCWDKRPLRESTKELLKTYNIGMRYGDVATACTAMSLHLRRLFFEGEQLSILQAKYELQLKRAAKLNMEAARMMILDLINIQFLTQQHTTFNPFSIFDGLLMDEDALLVDAQLRKNVLVVMAIYWRRFFTNFWAGSYAEAEIWAKAATAARYNKTAPPMILNLLTTGARGVIYFHLYRDGKGDWYFSEGEKMLKELEEWQEHCEHTVINRVHLMRAERFASICEVKQAKSSYEAAIKSSRDCGRVHDQALAYELFGNYLRSIVDIDKSIDCYKAAHSLYTQWGAVSIARRIQDKYLDGYGIEHVSLKRSFSTRN